jgi:hypothetical protein
MNFFHDLINVNLSQHSKLNVTKNLLVTLIVLKIKFSVFKFYEISARFDVRETFKLVVNFASHQHDINNYSIEIFLMTYCR